MSKGLGLLLLIIGAVTGYFLAGSEAQEVAMEAEHATHVAHEIRNVTENAPSVAVKIHGNNSTGFDAELSFTNFRLAPESVNGDDVPGEGHAHIYVDGEKINRVYSSWYHLGKFEPGSYEVEVRLSSNDHHELAVDDEVIKATTMIVVRDSAVDVMEMEEDHTHEEGEMDDHSHE